MQTPVPVETVTPEPQYNGRLLSVDMWDGKLSVVVSTGDPNDKRVRVLQPGESYNGITLREAGAKTVMRPLTLAAASSSSWAWRSSRCTISSTACPLLQLGGFRPLFDLVGGVHAQTAQTAQRKVQEVTSTANNAAQSAARTLPRSGSTPPIW